MDFEQLNDILIDLCWLAHRMPESDAKATLMDQCEKMHREIERLKLLQSMTIPTMIVNEN